MFSWEMLVHTFQLLPFLNVVLHRRTFSQSYPLTCQAISDTIIFFFFPHLQFGFTFYFSSKKLTAVAFLSILPFLLCTFVPHAVDYVDRVMVNPVELCDSLLFSSVTTLSDQELLFA